MLQQRQQREQWRRQGEGAGATDRATEGAPGSAVQRSSAGGAAAPVCATGGAPQSVPLRGFLLRDILTKDGQVAAQGGLQGQQQGGGTPTGAPLGGLFVPDMGARGGREGARGVKEQVGFSLARSISGRTATGGSAARLLLLPQRRGSKGDLVVADSPPSPDALQEEGLPESARRAGSVDREGGSGHAVGTPGSRPVRQTPFHSCARCPSPPACASTCRAWPRACVRPWQVA